MTTQCGSTATEAHLKLTLNAMGTLLANGQVHGLISYLECPLPVYFNDKFFLLQCHDRIAEALSAYVGEMTRCKVIRIEPSLLCIEDSTPHRSLFVARWSYYQEGSICTSSNVVRYVARRGPVDGLMRIELLEYLETGRVNMPAHLSRADA